jgi:2-polyprenyl-3-methyl-5-hydroxy-6-metoxy-1,4-benzoquinol methylase
MKPMKDRVKSIVGGSALYKPLRVIYRINECVYDFITSILYKLYPKAGVRNYQKMQHNAYDNCTQTYEDAKNLCVGVFDVHESYPYEEYLLEHFHGKRGRALDFACGIGRMMNRMLAEFESVDGVDLNQKNLEYAKLYLAENGRDPERTDLFKTSGTGVEIEGQESGIYDFIYSTIALQHIAVYEIRRQIFIDLYGYLKPGGRCCFQVGFGWDNGVHWFDNHYVARSTNAGCDVCIPDDEHFSKIEADFEEIGYKNVRFEMKISPHPGQGNRYHPIWLFIHLTK